MRLLKLCVERVDSRPQLLCVCSERTDLLITVVNRRLQPVNVVKDLLHAISEAEPVRDDPPRQLFVRAADVVERRLVFQPVVRLGDRVQARQRGDFDARDQEARPSGAPDDRAP